MASINYQFWIDDRQPPFNEEANGTFDIDVCCYFHSVSMTAGEVEGE